MLLSPLVSVSRVVSLGIGSSECTRNRRDMQVQYPRFSPVGNPWTLTTAGSVIIGRVGVGQATHPSLDVEEDVPTEFFAVIIKPPIAVGTGLGEKVEWW